MLSETCLWFDLSLTSRVDLKITLTYFRQVCAASSEWCAHEGRSIMLKWKKNTTLTDLITKMMGGHGGIKVTPLHSRREANREVWENILIQSQSLYIFVDLPLHYSAATHCCILVNFWTIISRQLMKEIKFKGWRKKEKIWYICSYLCDSMFYDK
jgi:hypothetical protein